MVKYGYGYQSYLPSLFFFRIIIFSLYFLVEINAFFSSFSLKLKKILNNVKNTKSKKKKKNPIQIIKRLSYIV